MARNEAVSQQFLSFAPPRLGMKLKSEFIRGMGKQGENFIIILDIDRIFSSAELCLIQAAEEAAVQTL